MNRSFGLIPALKKSEFFPDSRVNYPPQEPGSFPVRYYPLYDAWAFGEDNVAIADEINTLMAQLEEQNSETILVPSNIAPMKIADCYREHLIRQHKIVLALREDDEWPQEEIDVRAEYQKTAAAFLAQQEMPSRVVNASIASQAYAIYTQERAHKLGLKAELLQSLVERGIEKINREHLKALLANFFEEHLVEEQGYFDAYKAIPFMLDQVIHKAIFDADLTYTKKFHTPAPGRA